MSLSLVTAAGPSPDYVQGNKDKASREENLLKPSSSTSHRRGRGAGVINDNDNDNDSDGDDCDDDKADQRSPD